MLYNLGFYTLSTLINNTQLYDENYMTMYDMEENASSMTCDM